MKFLRTCFLLAALVVPSLSLAQESQQNAIRSFHLPAVETDGLREMQLWGTNYYVYKASNARDGIPLLDERNKELGPKLRPYDWCRSGIEGTVKVGDITYNYEDAKGSQDVDCAHVPKINVSVACHGRGRGFEPRRPRHKPKKIKGLWQVTRSRIPPRVLKGAEV
jgi:hypothetical protein